jgi:hypothetical protein
MLLARIVECLAGMPVSQLVHSRVLEPLGLPPVPWETDPAGHELGFSGAHVPTATIVALAQLHLGGGVLGGRRFLSEAWVAEATRGQGPERTDGEANPDWVNGYGYSFWQSRHGYRGDGAFGQFAVVLPAQDTVVAVTSETPDMQRVLDLLWEHVLPAVSDGAVPDPSADERLAQRLRSLAVPVPSSSPSGQGSPDRASFRRGARSTLPEPYSSLDVEPAPRDAAAAGWQLRLRRGDEVVEVAAGDGRWVASRVPFGTGDLAVEAAAGWVEAGRFRAELRLVDTPHTLVLEGDVDAGEATLGWRTVPMLGPDPALFVLPGGPFRL